MVQSPPWLQVLSALTLCGIVSAQQIVPSMSFGGQGDRLSRDGRVIPNWNLVGEGHAPQILSDRLILTPPAPGHVKGALWADNANPEAQWSAEVTFRAGGQDRGSGSFQIWYVKDGRSTVGSSSVYTVPTFEGLVLAVDQHGGRGGMLRGFLNDGSTNYKDHRMVDSLAFGHCDFPYRNLGRSSKVQMISDNWGLQVKIDGQPCFASEKVSLPGGYFFGMTAVTADNPDSFEVNAFTLTKGTARLYEGVQQVKVEQRQQQQQQQQSDPLRMPNAPEQIPDSDANAFQKQQEQFQDLHNRLQSMSHQINSIFAIFENLGKKIDDSHNDLIAKTPKSADDSVNALSRRIEGLEKSIREMQKDLAGRDYSKHLNDIHRAVEGVKGGLSDNLPDTLHQLVQGSAPRITSFIFAILAVESVLLGLYIVYKKRRDNAPKKYL